MLWITFLCSSLFHVEQLGGLCSLLFVCCLCCGGLFFSLVCLVCEFDCWPLCLVLMRSFCPVAGLCLPAGSCACLCLPAGFCAGFCLPAGSCACLCLPAGFCAGFCLPAGFCACLCLPAGFCAGLCFPAGLCWFL